MKAHTYEKAFLGAGIVVLLACMAALVYATLGLEIHLPGAHGRIDPAAVYRTPPFDAPGVRRIDDDTYEVVLVAQAWTFNPAEVRVPPGVEVRFTATSTDVIHGLNVEGTRLNMMLIPGQIAQNSYTFDEPGEYLIICHEYCGLGHHMMSGKVIVEGAATAAGEGGDPVRLTATDPATPH